MQFAKLPFISPIARAFHKPQASGATGAVESPATGPGPKAVPEDESKVESLEDELETESLEDIFGNGEISSTFV